MKKLKTTFLTFFLLLMIVPLRSQSFPVAEFTALTTEPTARFGHTVVSIPDISGDGIPDLVVGAPFEDEGVLINEAGAVYLVRSGGGPVTRIPSPNPTPNGRFGFALDYIIDNFGDPLILVGAPYEDIPTHSNAGNVHLFDQTGGWVQTILPSVPDADGYFGRAVAGVGAPDGNGNELFVVYQEEGSTSFADEGEVYAYELFNPLPVQTFVPTSPQTNLQFGFSLSRFKPGSTEFLIGVVGAQHSMSTTITGQVHVGDVASGTTYVVDDPDDLTIGRFGYDVADLGDRDANGRHEFLVGDPWEEDGLDGDGYAYIYEETGSGGANLIQVLSSPNPEARWCLRP